MKNAALFLLMTIAFTNCKNVESEQVINSNVKAEVNLTKVEMPPTTENLLDGLTTEQREKLDKSFSPKVKEILDKAEEIEVYASIDKDSKQLKVLYEKNSPNTVAKLSDASLKKQFLESFYYDAALGSGGFACWKPEQRILAKYNNQSVEFDICYHCSRFKGDNTVGKMGGSLNFNSKSLPIIKEILKKYGKEIQ